MFEYLYRHLDNINIDRVPEEYFIPDEDGVKYSPLYIYKMASEAEKYFKAKVLELDTEGIYTNEKTTLKIDWKATNENKADYEKQFEELDQFWEEYMDNHPDEFNEIEVVDAFDEEGILAHFHADLSLSLEDAWQGYITAGALKKQYGAGGEYNDQMPKYISRRSKADFRQEHKEIKNRKREELGIPAEEDLQVKIEQTTKGIKGGGGSKRVIQDPTILEDYSREFTEYLVRG